MTNHAGHQVHFLERLERVDGEEQELALKLYNDASFVRSYLQGEVIPDRFERVAFALSDDPQGPHAVVTREGAFVTCLGAGMEPHGLFVLPRERTVVLHGYLERMREAHERVRAATLNPRECLTAVRMENYRLSRERFLELRELSPLYSDEAYGWTLKHAMRISARREAIIAKLGSKARRVRKLTPGQASNLQEYWEDLFFLSHMTVVHACRAEEFETIYREPARVAEVVEAVLRWLDSELLFGVSTRALWCAAAYKDVLAPRMMDALRRGEDRSALFHASVMTVIALRDPSYYRSLHGLMSAWKSVNTRVPPAQRSPIQENQLRISEMVLHVLENTDEVRACHLAEAWEYYKATYAQLGQANWLLPPEELSDAEVLAFYQLALFDGDGGVVTLSALVDALPFIASASAEDLYPPAAIVGNGPTWCADFGVAWLVHLGMRLRERRPERVEKGPGRNDLCPCESGRKYKRCCARAGVS